MTTLCSVKKSGSADARGRMWMSNEMFELPLCVCLRVCVCAARVMFARIELPWPAFKLISHSPLLRRTEAAALAGLERLTQTVAVRGQAM